MCVYIYIYSPSGIEARIRSGRAVCKYVSESNFYKNIYKGVFKLSLSIKVSIYDKINNFKFPSFDSVVTSILP